MNGVDWRRIDNCGSRYSMVRLGEDKWEGGGAISIENKKIDQINYGGRW